MSLDIMTVRPSGSVSSQLMYAHFYEYLNSLQMAHLNTDGHILARGAPLSRSLRIRRPGVNCAAQTFAGTRHWKRVPAPTLCTRKCWHFDTHTPDTGDSPHSASGDPSQNMQYRKESFQDMPKVKFQTSGTLRITRTKRAQFFLVAYHI